MQWSVGIPPVKRGDCGASVLLLACKICTAARSKWVTYKRLDLRFYLHYPLHYTSAWSVTELPTIDIGAMCKAFCSIKSYLPAKAGWFINTRISTTTLLSYHALLSYNVHPWLTLCYLFSLFNYRFMSLTPRSWAKQDLVSRTSNNQLIRTCTHQSFILMGKSVQVLHLLLEFLHLLFYLLDLALLRKYWLCISS